MADELTMIGEPSAAGSSADTFHHRGTVDASPDAGVADAGHQKHFSHHEVHHHKRRMAGGDSSEHSRSAFAEAWDASKGKWLQGAAMFAGFAAVLGLSTLGVGALATFAGIVLNPIVAGAVGAAVAGALWLGGNEFIKTYRSAIANEDSRLNRTLDAAKERLNFKGQEPEPEVSLQNIGELGVLAGTLNSHLGTTAFVVEVPNAMLDAAEIPNQTVQDILAQGPQSGRQQLLERGAQTGRSHTDRLSDASDLTVDALTI